MKPKGIFNLKLLFILAFISAVAPFAIDMYLPTFPSIATEMNSSASYVQLTLTAFLLGMGLGQILIGPLSDKLGRRPPLLFFILLFIVSSLGCVLAPNMDTLIALRLIQGITGSAGVVISRALVADCVSSTVAAKTFSLLGAIGGIAPIIGPLLGGLLAEAFGWRGIMGALVAMGILMFVLAYRYIPETLPKDKRTQIPLISVYYSLFGMFKHRDFIAYALTASFAFGALMSYISSSPFLFQSVLGVSMHVYTLFFALNAAAIILGGILNNLLLKKYTPMTILKTAQICQFSVLILLTLVILMGKIELIYIETLIFLFLLCMGFMMGNAMALAISTCNPQSIGRGSAIIGFLFFGIGSLVSPLVGLAGSTSILPLALVILACSIISICCLKFFVSKPDPSKEVRA